MSKPIYMYMEQRSDEWFAARLGVITASACGDMMTVSKKKTFAYKILAEMLTGEKDKFEKDLSTNKYVLWGIEKEDEARAAYEAHTGNKVTAVGFVYRDAEKRVGCSPDGLIGDKGLQEIKCQGTKAHLHNIQFGPSHSFKRQMQFQLYAAHDRDWVDFTSYDPRPKNPALHLYIQRIHKDLDVHIDIDKAVTWTLAQIDKFLDKQGIKL